MKQWESFNQTFGKNQTLEEQTVRIYTCQILDRIEHSPVYGSLVEASEALPLMEIYRGVEEWLQEEVSP